MHPASPREHLMKYLTGEYLPPAWDETDHPVHKWRHAIIKFLSEYWANVHAQLKCPARNLRHPDEKRRDSRPCFGCTDHQVLFCVAHNAKYDALLRRHLPIKD